MKSSRHVVLLMVLLALLAISCAPRGRPALAQQPNDPELARHLLLLNAARSQTRDCGGRSFAPAPALTWNQRLAAAAYAHAVDMYQHDFFDHGGSDGSTVGQRINRAGYSWRAVAENLALGTPGLFTAETVLEGWLESPGHCANIMNPDVTELGVAKLEASYDYWVQVFAKPLGP